MSDFKKLHHFHDDQLQSIQDLRWKDQGSYWFRIGLLIALDANEFVTSFSNNWALPFTVEEAQRRRQVPLHLAFDPQQLLQKADGLVEPSTALYLYHYVHTVVHKKEELSNPLLQQITFVRLPEGIYTILFTEDEQGTIMEVFSPHFFERYAALAARSFYQPMVPPADLYSKEDTKLSLGDMVIFSSLFIGRNWAYHSVDNSELSSRKNKKINKDSDSATILFEGVAFDDVFTYQEEDRTTTILLHKTFVPWKKLKDDQKPIAEKYKQCLLETACSQYPDCAADFLTWLNGLA